MRNLTGKVAFVTGAASGIGFALARGFLIAGMKVMLADIEGPALDRALAELRAFGDRVRGTQLDVSSRPAIKLAADELSDAFGRVHILCNNAGVAAGGLQGRISAADWDWVIDVNLNGVFNGITEFLPRMQAHGEGGHIVNTASLAGIVSAPFLAPYCAAKYAVVALSEGLAAELAGSNIGVSVLCPSWVRTRIGGSRRNRPARYGPDPSPPTLDETAAAALETGMAPAVVAERVLAAVRANELYIITHPEMRAQAAGRFARILAAFDKAPALNDEARAKLGATP